jgi:uncharacterized protein (DUF305 family)
MLHRITLMACLAIGASACASSSAEPPSSAPPPVTVTRTHAPYTEADVAFMQGMIAHHGQALEMTALVPARSANATLQSLAERIEQTQLNEIQRMTRWLGARGETVPDPAAYREHSAGGHEEHGGHMPGMLTPAEMAELAGATGARFDRLFLESMIRHHEGALTMVAELQAAGGGNEAEVYIFAADVDADQRAEIARMQSMLNQLQ